MRESTVETYFKEQVKALGGETRKVKWLGRKGAPDDLTLLPGHSFFAELKAPGEKCRPEQLREHERLRAAGIRVEVIDSLERVDEVLRSVLANKVWRDAVEPLQINVYEVLR